jgi:pentatricopeptide repeat protein
MYAKCGFSENAQNVFEEMKQVGVKPDVVTWNALIPAYGQHGYVKKSLDSFQQMQQTGVKPNSITMIAVLNSCSHSGLISEAMQLLNSMKSRFDIAPNTKHQNCIVDALGRAGRLDEAEKFVHGMAEPDAVTWKTLLSACRTHGDVKRAEHAAHHVQQLDPLDAPSYVLPGNTHAAAKQFGLPNIWRDMLNKGIKKLPGQCWIQLNGRIHSFVAHDTQHEQNEEIRAMMSTLIDEMKQAGFKPDTSWVQQDTSKEEKLELLCSHSEKFAIVLGLINTPPGTTLRIVKNLRVCGDCHTATKFIPKLKNREIIVRDANRFHHFKDGNCSCNDYF